MKKSISKILSVMCNVAVLFAIFSMNFASAIFFTKEQAKEEILAHFKDGEELVKSGTNPLKASGESNTKELAAIIVYKLINVVGEKWPEGKEKFIEKISFCMEDIVIPERTTDSELNFIHALAEKLLLSMDPDESTPSCYVCRKIEYFCVCIKGIVFTIKNILTEPKIDDETKNICAKEIVLIIEQMSGFQEECYSKCIWAISNSAKLFAPSELKNKIISMIADQNAEHIFFLKLNGLLKTKEGFATSRNMRILCEKYDPSKLREQLLKH